jgi:hypothetical protein
MFRSGSGQYESSMVRELRSGEEDEDVEVVCVVEVEVVGGVVEDVV